MGPSTFEEGKDSLIGPYELPTDDQAIYSPSGEELEYSPVTFSAQVYEEINNNRY